MIRPCNVQPGFRTCDESFLLSDPFCIIDLVHSFCLFVFSFILDFDSLFHVAAEYVVSRKINENIFERISSCLACIAKKSWDKSRNCGIYY